MPSYSTEAELSRYQRCRFSLSMTRNPCQRSTRIETIGETILGCWDWINQWGFCTPAVAYRSQWRIRARDASRCWDTRHWPQLARGPEVTSLWLDIFPKATRQKRNGTSRRGAWTHFVEMRMPFTTARTKFGTFLRWMWQMQKLKKRLSHLFESFNLIMRMTSNDAEM